MLFSLLIYFSLFALVFSMPLLDFKFAMSGEHLHIWPRGEFMMIALPNDDHTFTGNIFAPFATLDQLKTPQDFLSFYQKQFPDLLELIGREKLVKDYFEREPKTLISIKVSLSGFVINRKGEDS